MNNHSPKPANRYFLCDQSLNGYSGHCYEYFLPIKSMLERENKEVFVLGNRDLDANFGRETSTIPLFTYWCDERNVGQPETSSPHEAFNAIRKIREHALLEDLSNFHDQFSL